MPESEIDLMVAECKMMFAEERSTRSPDDFNRLVGCLAEASNSAQLEACQ